MNPFRGLSVCLLVDNQPVLVELQRTHERGSSLGENTSSVRRSLGIREAAHARLRPLMSPKFRAAGYNLQADDQRSLIYFTGLIKAHECRQALPAQRARDFAAMAFRLSDASQTGLL